MVGGVSDFGKDFVGEFGTGFMIAPPSQPNPPFGLISGLCVTGSRTSAFPTEFTQVIKSIGKSLRIRAIAS